MRWNKLIPLLLQLSIAAVLGGCVGASGPQAEPLQFQAPQRDGGVGTGDVSLGNKKFPGNGQRPEPLPNLWLAQSRSFCGGLQGPEGYFAIVFGLPATALDEQCPLDLAAPHREDVAPTPLWFGELFERSWGWSPSVKRVLNGYRTKLPEDIEAILHKPATWETLPVLAFDGADPVDKANFGVVVLQKYTDTGAPLPTELTAFVLLRQREPTPTPVPGTPVLPSPPNNRYSLQTDPLLPTITRRGNKLHVEAGGGAILLRIDTAQAADGFYEGTWKIKLKLDTGTFYERTGAARFAVLPGELP